MAKKTGRTAPAKRSSKKAQRFAHPFFTHVPPAGRGTVPGVGNRMVDYVQQQLLPIPSPQRDPTITLDEIIGAQAAAEIAATGSISFHAVGDTGHENGLNQELVSEAMAADYDIANHASSPAFLLHLGDVIYFDNTDRGYQAQFYIPYKKYPGKIIAIPGNHDGELFKYDGTPSGQKVTLAAFQRNFCQPRPGVPQDAGTIYREMISQPGVYWYLNAPLIDVIGLYSNVGEGPGFISGPSIGQAQKNWLVKTLTAIAKGRTAANRKALIIAVHHPPYSEGGHSASSVMTADIDDACKRSGIFPDAVLAAHAHNYQRFTRYMAVEGQNLQTPYFVVGTGGRGIIHVRPADGRRQGDISFDASLQGYGYLTVTATRQKLSFSFTEVDNAGRKAPFDKTITVDLPSHQVTAH